MSYIDKIPPTGAPSPLGDKKGKNNQNNNSSNGTTSSGKSFDEYLKEARKDDKDNPPEAQFFNNVLRKPIINFDSASDIKSKITNPSNEGLKNIGKKIAEDKSKKVEAKPIIPVKTENKIDASASDKNANKMSNFINNYRDNIPKVNPTVVNAVKTPGGGSTSVNPATPVSTVGSGVLKKPEVDGGGQSNNQQSRQPNNQNQQVQPQINEQPTQAQPVQETQQEESYQGDENNKDFRNSDIYKRGKEIVTGNIKSDRTVSTKEGKAQSEKLNEDAKSYNEGTLNEEGVSRFKAETNELQKEVDKAIKNGWGIQKWATAGGAVFGAISKYKKDLERWEYECQRAAAEGRPMPKKPSLAGSMISGAAGGATAGFMVGGVAKHVGPISRIDKNLKTAGANRRMQQLNEEKGYDAVKELARRKGMSNQAIAKETNTTAVKYIRGLNKTLNKDKQGGGLTQDALGYIGRLTTTSGGFNALRNNVGIFKNMTDAQIKDWYINANQMTGRTAFFSEVAYVSKCFSVMEAYRNSAIRDVEKFRELYNFYTLHMNEEPMDVYTFLRECFDYPSFARYIEQAMERFIQEELITFSDLIEGCASDTLSNYKVLYKNYQTICGTTLDPQEFLERCVTYPSYVEYITKKLKRTELLKMGLQSFAEVGITSLPQNVQVNGENIDTTEEGLPDAKNYESMKNQNSLQTKEQQAKARQSQLQKQKEEQQKQQQIEANKANYAKTQQAKMQDKITKLSQQKAAISKNLGRNASDMQVGQLAQEKQKVTDLNLKIQAIKADTKNKIANYKGTGGKNFSLKKPLL